MPKSLKIILLSLLSIVIFYLLYLVYTNRKHFIEYEKWNSIIQLDTTYLKLDSYYIKDNESTKVENNYASNFKILTFSTTLLKEDIDILSKIRFGLNYPLAFIIEINNTPLLYSPNIFQNKNSGKIEIIQDHRLSPERTIEWFLLSKMKLKNTANELKVRFIFDSKVVNIEKLDFIMQTSQKGFYFRPFNRISKIKSNSKNTLNISQIHISTNNASIPDEPKIKGNMTITHKDDFVDKFNIKIEKRGTSSQRQSFKNSYSINLYNKKWKKKPDGLLGLTKDNKWVLYAPYYDKSLIRNALAYTLGQGADWYCPSLKKCEVYVDEEYKGVYYLTEKITDNKTKLNIKKSGFLAQIDRPESKEFGFYLPNKEYLNYPYITFKSPDMDKLKPLEKNNLKNYFYSLDSLFNDKNRIDEVWKYVDIKCFTDLFIFNELAQNIDAYRLSTYMYKIDSNSKLKFGPLWDFNHGFGNCSVILNEEGWAFNLNNPSDEHTMLNWWENAFNFSDEFRNSLVKSWESYRNDLLSDKNIIQIIDSLANDGSDATTRNFEQFNILNKPLWWNCYVGGNYENEIFYIKCWTIKRLKWLDNSILPKEFN